MKDDNKKDDKKKKGELTDSLHPKTIKGPQKSTHTNQYGDKDDATRVQ